LNLVKEHKKPQLASKADRIQAKRRRLCRVESDSDEECAEEAMMVSQPKTSDVELFRSMFEPEEQEPEVTNEIVQEPEVTNGIVQEPEVTNEIVQEPDVTNDVVQEPEVTNHVVVQALHIPEYAAFYSDGDKDKEIKLLQAHLEERDEHLKTKDELLKTKDDVVTTKNEVINTYDLRMLDKDAEIERIRNDKNAEIERIKLSFQARLEDKEKSYQQMERMWDDALEASKENYAALKRKFDAVVSTL